MGGSPGRRGLDRREFLGGLAAASLPAWVARAAARPPAEATKVAAIVTEFTYRSHAHVILENFLGPYLFNGRRIDPDCKVVALYVDQFPRGDMAREVAKSLGIPIYPTIGEAVRAGGTGLGVDGVLSIGEQGRYPVNAKGQREYPRKRFFDEVVKVFEESGRGVPVFNDKHLSYRWDWARQMYDTARRLHFPLMAGSSVPLAQRRPPLELPATARFLGAVSIHGGPLEGYDFHGLEVLQSLVEARRGGEVGVARVQFLQGDALWKAADDGLWSVELADAAMAAELGPGQPTLRELLQTPPFKSGRPHGILVTYRDGLRAVVLKVGNSGTRWNFACRLVGDRDPRATRFYVGPWQNRNLFKALSHAIQGFFRDQQAPYPVERTLLTTGVLDAAMDSRARGGEPVETPQLAIAYDPVDFRPWREMGATWEIVTERTPEPRGLDTTGRDLGK
jgi:hypothetical protein